jgi:hypothetical protein
MWVDLKGDILDKKDKESNLLVNFMNKMELMMVIQLMGTNYSLFLVTVILKKENNCVISAMKALNALTQR